MIRGFLWNWAPWIYNHISNTIDIFRRVVKVSYNEISVRNEWCILKHTNVPIFSSFFPNIPPHTIDWVCTLNPPKFTSGSGRDYKHISYLGCTLHIPGYDSIDITEWINTIEWSGKNEPSLMNIFQLWCCETGNSYFHLIPQITVTLITEMGDEIVKGLNDSSISILSNGFTGISQSHLDRSNSDRAMDAILSSSGC